MENEFIGDVKDFHKKFKIPIQQRPGFPAEDRTLLRLELIVEEVAETIDAFHNRDIVEIADGLVDIIYVCIGAALELGIPVQAVWEEVHHSNMQKVGGRQRDDGKILKPDGWKAPDIKSILDSFSQYNHPEEF